MKLINLVFFIFLCGILVSCSENGGNSTSFNGNWYLATSDTFVEISSDDTVFIRECTLNDGYRVSYTGTINGDTIFLNDGGELILRLESDTLFVTVVSTDEVLELARMDSIPSLCQGDAIEITYVSPTSAIEGVLTTYIVNFDYRLSSSDSGEITLSFNTVDPNGFEVLDTLILPQAETSSGSLTADVVPILYSSPNSFELSVDLWRYPRSSFPTSIYTARYAITVTQ